jgi:hypothetical protein
MLRAAGRVVRCSARPSTNNSRATHASLSTRFSFEFFLQVAGPLWKQSTGIWQQQWAELNVDQKILAMYMPPPPALFFCNNLNMYKDEGKDEHIITYNFDLENTEMIIPQVCALPSVQL